MKKIIITIVLIIILTASYLAYRVNKEPVVSTLNENMATTTMRSSYSTSTIQQPEVVKDFEDNGNIGPGIFNKELNEKTWTWIQTTYPTGTAYIPKQKNKFKLTFSDKTFSVVTDCNGIGGEYTVNKKSIKFDKMMSTMMYCEGSQESEFSKMLSEVVSYDFTFRGELLLNLKDSGTMLYE